MSAGEVGMVRVRVAAALLFVGGLVYAMLSGNWGTGAITFSLGVVLLGLDRLGVAQRRSDRAVGWVGTRAVRRVNRHLRRNQDRARRNIGSFSAWCAWCAMNCREYSISAAR